MNLEISKIRKDDIRLLVEPMKNAFDDDAKRFKEDGKGGPPGYDDGSFLDKWVINTPDTLSYKISVDNEVIGAFILWWNKNSESILGTIFISPEYQNKGIGKKVWKYIESNFPTKSWKLETPVWSTRNHHYYEKVCGFIKHSIEDDQIIYKKKYLIRKL